MTINSIELFTGAGGLAMGMQLAGCHHRALIEWDKDSCDTLRGNISSGYPPAHDWHVIQSDVRKINYSSLDFSVQLISGGPPCQPFSLGGKHQAYNDHRDMFPEAVRAVRELKPKAFVFENVKGLLRKSFSTYFNYILLQLTYPDVIRTKFGSPFELHQGMLTGHQRTLFRSEIQCGLTPFKCCRLWCSSVKASSCNCWFPRKLGCGMVFP